jgi:hypothetical protein
VNLAVKTASTQAKSALLRVYFISPGRRTMLWCSSVSAASPGGRDYIRIRRRLLKDPLRKKLIF